MHGLNPRNLWEFPSRSCTGGVACNLLDPHMGTAFMQSSRWRVFSVLALCAVPVLAACGEPAKLTVADGSGVQPELPAPSPSLIPVIDIAPATGWASGRMPVAAHGLAVAAFARDLDHPRWLYVLPNGDILVAETNAPERESARKGIKKVVMARAMKKAGSATPSADRITLLRDADGDGDPEVRTTFAADLHSPFGMALVGDDFYVANTDAVLRFDYRRGATSVTGPGVMVAPLPAGPVNHHWTKNVIASPDGTKLYATVGSNSNVGERGLDEEQQRAAILEIDAATGTTAVFASGLRNPNGLAWEPQTGALWTVVNERDEIGSDLVPDYLTSVVRGGFYGWPYSYFGAHVDERVSAEPRARGHCARARLRARPAHGLAGARVLRRRRAAGLSRRCVHRAARLVEP